MGRSFLERGPMDDRFVKQQSTEFHQPSQPYQVAADPSVALINGLLGQIVWCQLVVMVSNDAPVFL